MVTPLAPIMHAGSKWEPRRLAVVAGALSLLAGCGAHGPARAERPLVCPKTDGLAERAVAEAEAAFPGPLGYDGPLDKIAPDKRFAYLMDHSNINKRLTYINQNLARLFDPDGTGYLDFQRYDDWQWTATMVAVPSVRCAMDFHQYRNSVHGSDKNISQIDKNMPFVAKVDAITFSQLSSDGQYITRQDLTRRWSRPSFQNFDTNGDGRAPLDGKLAAYTGKKKEGN